MSVHPDPRQFGRRHIEQRPQHQAKFAALALYALFIVALYAALQLDIGDGGRVLLVVLAFGALLAGMAAAYEA